MLYSTRAIATQRSVLYGTGSCVDKLMCCLLCLDAVQGCILICISTCQETACINSVMCGFCVYWFVSAHNRRKLALTPHMLLVVLQTSAHIDSDFEV